jgi:hypothetical protein
MVKKSFNRPIPDIVQAQQKSFYPLGASEHKVFSVVSMVCHVGERPALEMLDPQVYRVAYLHRLEHSKVALTLHRGANLKNSILISIYYCILLSISTHYYYQ